MRSDPLANWLAGLAAIAAIYAVGVFSGLTMAADPPRPPSVPGWVAIQPCVLSGKSDVAAAWVLVDPDEIATLSNPPGSPAGCVKLISRFNRSLFVRGTEESLAKARNDALAERQKLGSP